MAGLGLSRGRFQWRDATEPGESGFVTAAAWVGPRHQDLGGHQHANAGFVEQRRRHRAHQRDHRQLEFTALIGEVPDAVRGAAQ